LIQNLTRTTSSYTRFNSPKDPSLRWIRCCASIAVDALLRDIKSSSGPRYLRLFRDVSTSYEAKLSSKSFAESHYSFVV
jgi:transketolase C-terminal domain/subunit